MSEPDTADLRAGAPINDALLALLPLVGVWTGGGHGVTPDGEQFAFGQQLSFVHDGRPFLVYESRAWLVDESGATIRQAWRESGFWRLGGAPDDDRGRARRQHRRGAGVRRRRRRPELADLHRRRPTARRRPR